MSEDTNNPNESTDEMETVIEQTPEGVLHEEDVQYNVVGSLSLNEETVKRILLTAVSEQETNKEFLEGETMCTFRWHTSKWDSDENLCTIVFSKRAVQTDSVEEVEDASVEE